MVSKLTNREFLSIYPINEWGRTKGFIKFYNRAAGNGFIVSKEEYTNTSDHYPEDIFFHITEFKPRTDKILTPGLLVEFRLQFTPQGGVRALDCVLLTHGIATSIEKELNNPFINEL